MKVDIQENRVVCVADDWKDLKRDERQFLSKCYFAAIWTDITKEGNLIMGVDCSDIISVYRRLGDIFLLANTYGVEVTDAVKLYKESLTGAVSKERLIRERAQEARIKREAWEERKKTGCDYCPHSERLGDAWFRCKYSGDELDCRVSSVYDPAHNCMDFFHECGVPNEHCKSYFEDKIIKGGAEA